MTYDDWYYKREEWLSNNFYAIPDDVLEDDNGDEFLIVTNEEGKEKVYLPEELQTSWIKKNLVAEAA